MNPVQDIRPQDWVRVRVRVRATKSDSEVGPPRVDCYWPTRRRIGCSSSGSSSSSSSSTATANKQHRFGGMWSFPVLCVDTCLLYTSDAADEEDSVDLGGRRIIKKKKKRKCKNDGETE
eukprot:TRINITY_DN9942_c0_g4_i7.p1 TRINITY_DN9942_c0_g4~~TRINITY_DN9942_c0_g4_i7.p1  ORF type:complete len:119 (+),score=18.88 TRINITY_DN9942_c0_g4_i7:528-884(+)